MKLINVKYYLVRCTLLVVCIFLLASFTFKTTQNFNSDTAVSIVQENDGFTISVKTIKNNTNIHFYMFTVDGRLVKELNIYGSKRISITPLEKGIYIYDFFSNDERLKNGKIELR